MIPLSVPEIRGREWRYMKECLDTGWVSSVGEYVDRFEQMVADYLGCRYAVACVNGTAALHTALLIAGIKPREEVIVPALTFVAPANAVRYLGGYPIFVDVDPDFWQIDPQKISDFIRKECEEKNGILVNRNTKRVVRAIIPVHILGHPVNMEPLLEIARRYNLIVIEDAAESLGACYKKRKTGSLADIGCLSFNGNKIITTGGGGMIVTNNPAWAKKARYLTTQAKDDSVEYIHKDIGFNYRLTNIQAAMGVAQMETLDQFIVKKRDLASRYDRGLKGIDGLTLPKQAGWAKPNFWLYTILIDEDRYGKDSRSLMQLLGKEGIQTRPLWCPLTNLTPFSDCYAYKVEIAQKLYKTALSLPSSVGLKARQQNKVIQMIKKLASK